MKRYFTAMILTPKIRLLLKNVTLCFRKFRKLTAIWTECCRLEIPKAFCHTFIKKVSFWLMSPFLSFSLVTFQNKTGSVKFLLCHSGQTKAGLGAGCSNVCRSSSFRRWWRGRISAGHARPLMDNWGTIMNAFLCFSGKWWNWKTC